VLPTPAFFYGLRPGEEISVEHRGGQGAHHPAHLVGEPDKDGRRAVSYELNGIGARDADPRPECRP
jgi:pyruvate carboxylase